MQTARDLFPYRKLWARRFGLAPSLPMSRAALRRMGRGDLIGNAKHQLIPSYQPAGTGHAHEGARKGQPFKTQHTGLPHVAPPKKANRPARNFHTGSPTGAGKRG